MTKQIIGNELAGKTIFVTGATGFIGRHLVAALLDVNARVKVLVRKEDAVGLAKADVIQVVADLSQGLPDHVCDQVDTIFHLAGYAHTEDANDPRIAQVHWRITVEGTRALLAQAAQGGVRRFIFISSVKAMGEGVNDACLDETTISAPVTSYGKAKREAEKAVLEASDRGIHATVLRLPMVYGPGCKGNLPRMVQAIDRGRFPPLRETGNKRSMVDVRDVVQAALLAATHPVATGKMYIVTDGQAYSTRQIYEWILAALQRPVPRWTVPPALLRWAACMGDVIGYLGGRRFIFDTYTLNKLAESAWYSSSKICHELNYQPRHNLRDSIHEMVRAFKKAE